MHDLATEKAKAEKDSEPSNEEFEEAREYVWKRPMGEAWLSDDLELPSLIETTTSVGWQVNPVYTRYVAEDSKGQLPEPDGPTLSDLTIRYVPEDENLERAGLDPDSVSKRDVRSFGGDTTWRDGHDRMVDHYKTFEEQRKRHERTLNAIEFRRRILKNVLHQFEAYGSVEEMTEERAENITQDETESRIEAATPAKWEKNAAMMHACFENYGAPEDLSDVDAWMEKKGPLDSFSYEHTWKTLRRKNWASSKGDIKFLEEALNQWAPNFQKKYGLPKSCGAAKPFEWPFQQGMQ